MYRVPARRMEEGSNGEVRDARRHEIAVESREAETTKVFVGDARARTWIYSRSDILITLVDSGHTSSLWASNVAESL